MTAAPSGAQRVQEEAASDQPNLTHAWRPLAFLLPLIAFVCVDNYVLAPQQVQPVGLFQSLEFVAILLMIGGFFWLAYYLIGLAQVLGAVVVRHWGPRPLVLGGGLAFLLLAAAQGAQWLTGNAPPPGQHLQADLNWPTPVWAIICAWLGFTILFIGWAVLGIGKSRPVGTGDIDPASSDLDPSSLLRRDDHFQPLTETTVLETSGRATEDDPSRPLGDPEDSTDLDAVRRYVYAYQRSAESSAAVRSELAKAPAVAEHEVQEWQERGEADVARLSFWKQRQSELEAQLASQTRMQIGPGGLRVRPGFRCLFWACLGLGALAGGLTLVISGSLVGGLLIIVLVSLPLDYFVLHFALAQVSFRDGTVTIAAPFRKTRRMPVDQLATLRKAGDPTTGLFQYTYELLAADGQLVWNFQSAIWSDKSLQHLGIALGLRLEWRDDTHFWVTEGSR